MAFPDSNLLVVSIVTILVLGGCAASDSQRSDEWVSEASPRNDVASPGGVEASSATSQVAETTVTDEPSADDPTWIDVEVATVGWDGLTGTPVVLLRELDGTRRLPIWIGLAEAQAIARKLYGVEPPRPMSHDLMASLIDVLDAELETVRVTDLRNGTFHGRLELRRPDGEAQSVDTRPSDGLALGLRTGARLCVRSSLFDEGPDVRFEAPQADRQVVQALGVTVAWSEAEAGGVVVVALSDAARAAGFEVGDLVLRVDGRAITEPMGFLDALQNRERTGDLEVVVRRGDRETTVRLPLDRPRSVPRREAEV